jgi:NADPH-dependent ferric siderophore reductase
VSLASSTTPRIPRPFIELEVLRTQRLGDQLVRVRLGGDGFAQFEDRPETDKYVKLQFAVPGDELRPTTRTYTIRRVDTEARALDIDFVVHGDDGIAGPWAAAAQPGDRLRFLGPGGGYRPNPDAAWHLLVGDLSALPAIAAAIDALPASAVGLVIIEATDAEAVIDLEAPEEVEVRWLIDPEHEAPALADAVQALRWPDGRVDVFAHGERESMKALRRVLFEVRGLERPQVSLSGYWARGRAEERFQAEKREPIGRIDPVD